MNGDLASASETVRPEYAGVANAIGAAIAQVGGEAESLMSYRSLGREPALEQVKSLAIKHACNAGACPDSIRILDIEETEVPYMDGEVTRVRVKVVGELNALSGSREVTA